MKWAVGLLAALLAALCPRLADAQARDTTPMPPGVTVSGIVRDSLARAPLAGAIVQLVAADSMGRFGSVAVSDLLGRFTHSNVPKGRYTLGFFHPLMDSLGVEPPLREVHVDGQQPVRVDLASPSPAKLRAAICGARSADSGAVVVGVVRNARDRLPAAAVAVTGEWLELTLTPQGLVRRVPRLVATTGENGWFAICNVPTGGAMTLIATRGADSTDRIEVRVSADGFLRRELYLGSAGDGRLNGTVVTAVGARPLASAQVGIADGPQTRTNEGGEWTLADAPFGTRMLEVRAVGYYPERRAVDVVAGAAPIRIALSTMKAVLDTVRVTARLNDRLATGFAERRRIGVGRFLGPDDVARRRPIVTSDLFRAVAGLHLERDPLGETQVTMRDPFAGRCFPAVYLDGHYMGGALIADDIDSWVRPSEIAGIEIYVAGTVPPQYSPALGGCGSIVIWTKPPPASAKGEASMKRRMLTLAGVAAAGVTVAALAVRR